MKVLVLGAGGQLGWELQRTCPPEVFPVYCDVPKVDFFSTESIVKCITATRPDCIINAAAYTAVDKAEQEPAAADRINHGAVREIAELCRRNSIFLTHISTDFVFSGRHFKPYQPDDPPDPESIYGKTKLAGEQAVRKTLDEFLIIRTAWLYSSHGSNFVKTMLRLMQEKPEINVIDEQIGTPTWAHGLARAVWTSLDKNIQGIFHWTDAGVASWYDFAVAIQEEGIRAKLFEKAIPILPVASSQYPTPAQRPMYSVLDKSSFWRKLEIKPVHWRVQLRSMVKEISGVRPALL
jgi:dTDP-4-dehydrorhamnose reductase